MRGIEATSTRPAGFTTSWLRLACPAALFAVALACVAQDAKPAQSAPANTAQAVDAKTSSGKDSKGQKGSAETERKKQIADESAELLTMALALKAEVDKTTKDTLSLNVIKKADQIEKLAKSVKEKMKQSSGS